MRIIVTGATGFVGQHLLRVLTTQHELVCLMRAPKSIEQMDGLKVIEGDLRDPGSFDLLPRRADAIIHLAQANARFPEAANELFAVNTLSTQRLANYAREANVSHFVYASSGSIYGRMAVNRESIQFTLTI